MCDFLEKSISTFLSDRTTFIIVYIYLEVLIFLTVHSTAPTPQKNHYLSFRAMTWQILRYSSLIPFQNWDSFHKDPTVTLL